MVVVGIDPATYELGVGVIEVTRNDKITLLDVKHISVSKKQGLGERLGFIYNEIAKIITKHNPDYVGIESQYLAINPSAFRKICYSVGVIWAAVLLNSDAEVVILESSKWRKVALGNGRASKKDAVQQMAKKFQLKPSQYEEDDFEALGVAVAVAKLTETKQQ